MQPPHLQPFAKDPLYFLTTCTAKRHPILANAMAGEILRELWTNSAPRAGWFVGRFVIMPDHVHFFARPARDALLCADWMKAWKSVSARQIAGQSGIQPPIWQRGYFDHFVRSATSYAEKWEYVRQNPVRRGFVSRPEDWPWQGVIHDLTF